jgi:hypothetical protein
MSDQDPLPTAYRTSGGEATQGVGVSSGIARHGSQSLRRQAVVSKIEEAWKAPGLGGKAQFEPSATQDPPASGHPFTQHRLQSGVHVVGSIVPSEYRYLGQQ